jgi:RNA polymerase sigma-70 factor (ECF subfamily)
MTITTFVRYRPVTGDGVDLLARLQTGDRDAFADLYRGTADRLTRYVAARLRQRDADAVEDVVQEAFCLALADPQLLDAAARLDAAAGRPRDHPARLVAAPLRPRRPHVYEDRTAGIPPAPPTAMPRRPGFSQALARLSVLQRQVIQLRYLDGYPRDRAAAQMRCTLTSLRWLECCALRRLHAECAGNIARP